MTSPNDENAGDGREYPAEDAMSDPDRDRAQRPLCHGDLDAEDIVQLQHHENTRDPDKVTSS